MPMGHVDLGLPCASPRLWTGHKCLAAPTFNLESLLANQQQTSSPVARQTEESRAKWNSYSSYLMLFVCSRRVAPSSKSGQKPSKTGIIHPNHLAKHENFILSYACCTKPGRQTSFVCSRPLPSCPQPCLLLARQAKVNEPWWVLCRGQSPNTSTC